MSNDALETKLTVPGSTLYYALRQLPDSHRLPCLGLFCLHGELHDLVFNKSETVYIQSGWWREECARLSNGHPRHPVTQAISKWHDHPQANLLDWLKNLESLTGVSGFSDETELLDLCATLTRPLFAAYSYLLQDLDTNSNAYFEDSYINKISIAYSLFGFMQNLGQYLRSGIVPIPRSELRPGQPSAGEILRQRLNPSFQSVMEVQYNRLAELLSDLTEQSPANTGHKQAPISTIVAIQQAVLKEMRRSSYDVIDNHIDITPLRKMWISWNTQPKLKANA